MQLRKVVLRNSVTLIFLKESVFWELVTLRADNEVSINMQVLKFMETDFL